MRPWSSRLLFRTERFDPDGVGQFGADAQTNVADLADDVVVLAEKFDPLFLAEAHLAQPMRNFRRSGKLFDPAGRAHPHVAEWADETLRATLGGGGG